MGSAARSRRAGDRLSEAALAAVARCSRERIRQLAQLRLIVPADGRYAPGDVHRVRLADAFEAAGVPVEALADASRGGAISLAYYDRLHPVPGPSAEATYGELLARLGDRAALLRRVSAVLGFPEPDRDEHLERADEQVLLEMLDVVEANRDPDLALRVVRVLADAARRVSDAAMSTYGEAVERVGDEVAGVPPVEVFERFLEPWARLGRLAPSLMAWLTAQHLTTAIDAWSVADTERLLAQAGYVAPRAVAPPAIVFIDLTAFTRLSEERGDRAAAGVAIAFMQLAADVAETSGGRLVKPLGDGVLLRFPDAGAGVAATLDVLEQLGPAGLPSGHAGIAAGPVIARDGDVFGRTVNLAARLADRAAGGELLATEELVAGLDAERYHWAPAGEVRLQGIEAPQPLVRISRRVS